MLVEIRDGDRAMARHAMDMMDKRLDRARDELETLRIDSSGVQEEQYSLKKAREAVEKDDAPGVCDIEIGVGAAQSLRTALALYRSKLLDVKKAEEKEQVETDYTEARIAAIDDFSTRLGGQTSLNLTATVTVK